MSAYRMQTQVLTKWELEDLARGQTIRDLLRDARENKGSSEDLKRTLLRQFETQVAYACLSLELTQSASREFRRVIGLEEKPT